MKFFSYVKSGRHGLACELEDGTRRGCSQGEHGYPGTLLQVLQEGQGSLRALEQKLLSAPLLDVTALEFLPPLVPPKVICAGLNYLDHTAESPYRQPAHPTLFGRFTSSLTGHRQPILRPFLSETLDYEGEMAVIIGRSGRHIRKDEALSWVAGYAVFNDCTVREYARQTTQWTLGKNFDRTGAFGPCFVSADKVPPGGSGLRIATRLNGQVVQQANTADMIFDVATLISTISAAITLEPGDVIATGTPAGVGGARKPPLYLKAGDMCEVEIEGIGVLSNPIVDEEIPTEKRVPARAC